jgi:hypothetical protein
MRAHERVQPVERQRRMSGAAARRAGAGAPRVRREAQRGRWQWWLAPALLMAVGVLWLTTGHSAPDRAEAAAASTSAAASAAASSSGQRSMADALLAASPPRAPFATDGQAAREQQLALWQQRLQRAQQALQAYKASTRYPFSSQPLAADSDQAHPNEPVAEEQQFRSPGRKDATPRVHLRTTQERVFVQGNESVRFTVSLVDDQGNRVPLRILHASAREAPKPHDGSLYPEVPLDFNDNGTGGDLAPADGIYSASLQPATQGFAGLLGQIRVEVFMQYNNDPGFTYFDIVYTPQSPADWAGPPREAQVNGSLDFVLPATVREAGRYVVIGRVDDATGKPIALLTFNDEVAAGPQAFTLTLFGKLIRDAKPQFPLTLRDVVAFRLRPDAYPDRELMPRLSGPLLQTRSYPLTSFSDAEWTSEERQRYLDELGKDVTQAQDKVGALQQASGP